jgi:O-antigen ligase
VLIGFGGMLSTLSYLASPVVAVAVPLAVGFLVLSCVAPAAAVAGGCAAAVLEGHEVPLGGLGALSATECAFLVVAVGWVWRAITGAADVRYPQIADYPVIGLVLCLPVGLVFDVPVSVVLRLGVMWAAFFLVFLTVKAFTPSELRMVLLSLGLGAGVLGALGTAGYLLGGGAQVDVGGGVTGRAVGGIRDPNYYAAYLVLAGTPLLALVIARRTRWRAVAALAVGFTGLGVVLSLSRGGLLAAAFAVTVVVLAWSRTRLLSGAVIAVLIATAALNVNPLLNSGTSEVISDRLATIGTSSQNDKRSLIWREALDVTIARPLGIGALQFSTVAERRGLTQRGQPLENVHNTYLNIAVELGVLGLVCYLLWLVRTAWDLVVEFRRRRLETFAVVVGVGAALVGYSFQALTVSQYRVQTVLATFFVLAGAAAAARQWQGAPAQASEPAAAFSAARS